MKLKTQPEENKEMGISGTLGGLNQDSCKYKNLYYVSQFLCTLTVLFLNHSQGHVFLWLKFSMTLYSLREKKKEVCIP